MTKSTTLRSATAPFDVPSHFLCRNYQPTTTIRAISTTSPKIPPQASTASSATMAASSLPHLTPSSEVHLTSTSAKSITHRVAVAIGHVRFSNHEPLRLIQQNAIKKGDVLAVARIAAIQAVKKTSDFIPLAHGGVPVEGCIVRIEPVGFSWPHTQPKDPTSVRKDESTEEALQLFRPLVKHGGVRISVQVETTAKTGVEMEALTGVMGAALTIVDMCKGVDKECTIAGVRVVGKKGGRSGGLGIWREEPDEESHGQGVTSKKTKKNLWKVTQTLIKVGGCRMRRILLSKRRR